MDNPFSSPIGKKIFGAFGQSQNDWRSIGGIERYSGISSHEIESYFKQYANWFIKSPIAPGGMPLYKPNLEQFKF